MWIQKWWDFVQDTNSIYSFSCHPRIPISYFGTVTQYSTRRSEAVQAFRTEWTLWRQIDRWEHIRSAFNAWLTWGTHEKWMRCPRFQKSRVDIYIIQVYYIYWITFQLIHVTSFVASDYDVLSANKFICLHTVLCPRAKATLSQTLRCTL